jgi:Skp family chaperone for outer membrane proteins
MKTYQKLLFGCAMVAPVFLSASTAQAQVSGVAVIQPEGAILGAKAFDAANGTIVTQYKPQLDQAAAREQALNTELQTLSAPLDTNKDGRVSEEEVRAAQAAKSPVIAKIEAAQRSGQADIARLRGPATLAQLYAIEQIEQHYGPALKTVIDTKKVTVLLAATATVYTVPAADITDDVRNELDRVAPTVPSTPPANWQPSQQTVQLLQFYNQQMQIEAARQRQQGPAGTRPGVSAAPGKAPQGR